jgi:transcriptional regulator with XRE-family HTH domain
LEQDKRSTMMEQFEDASGVNTTSHFIAEMMMDEKDGEEFTLEYLKARFLSSIGRSLYYARRKAGLTQAEVAERMNTQQPAIARLEADRNGSISFRRYVDFAIACGMMPRSLVLAPILEPIGTLRDEVIAHVESQRAQELDNAWHKVETESPHVSQYIPSRTLTIQAVLDAAHPTTTAVVNQEPYQEEKLPVQFAERILYAQYWGRVDSALPQRSGEGVTGTASLSHTVTQAQTRGTSAGSAVLRDKVAA